MLGEFECPPVLFLIFNRPDTTFRVFEAIKRAKPMKLYVAADGPRPGRIGEMELCEQTRSIINKVDWECEVFTLFRENNLGCGQAVSQAISWFFEKELEGIILEDDCLPNDSFFRFCAKMLIKYRYEKDVMHIGAVNSYKERMSSTVDYYFSMLPQIWGWASWSDRWSKYKFDIHEIEKPDLRKYTNSLKIQLYFDIMYQRLINYHHHFNTWDYQWTYSIWENNGKCIAPTVNLVQNIGFNSMGTHTNHLSGAKEYYIDELYGEFVEDKEEINKEFDELTFNYFFKPKFYFLWILKYRFFAKYFY